MNNNLSPNHINHSLISIHPKLLWLMKLELQSGAQNEFSQSGRLKEINKHEN